ncbi:hypothetical protein [Streptomyces avermitilis]|uniref:Uncharacterized protein n=1 Tax=Streptomyces avermitilis TaxID=33903 RepID=A0A4D4MA85_STRAX|nr:hypothetical protein [Streptomyces avermitilis]GDY68569.1 hypothetical protein SAV14893_079620 [Streptomyces avermitilis]GDY71055.1 hypothetical protein SAV31267_005400 [Streptomyces avermitilis]
MREAIARHGDRVELDLSYGSPAACGSACFVQLALDLLARMPMLALIGKARARRRWRSSRAVIGTVASQATNSWAAAPGLHSDDLAVGVSAAVVAHGVVQVARHPRDPLPRH